MRGTVSSLGADEVALLAEAARGVLSRTWSSPLVAGRPDAGTTGLRRVWDAAVDQGWTALGTEAAFDAAIAVMAELGRSACPLPLIDVYVTTRLLGRREDLVDAVVGGAVRPVVAVSDDVDVRVLRFIEAAQAATHVLVVSGAGAEAVLHRIVEAEPTPGLAAPPWCDVHLEPRPAGTARVEAVDVEEAKALLRLGFAVRAMAAAGRAHELAVEHAKVRVQFGKPIGSYQAVQHRSADCAIEVSAARLLTQEAVRLHARSDLAWLLAAELAAAHAARAALGVQLGAHHTLAAVGFFEEHEAPWLFRRVHADVTRMCDLRLAQGEPADVLIESGADLPRLDLGQTAETFRNEVCALSAAHSRQSGVGRIGDDPDLVAALAAAGYLGMGWPVENGGRCATVEEQMVLSEELDYHRTRASMARSAADILGNAIVRHGTAEQKARFLPLIALGRLAYYLGYSEPDVGSDLASLQTRAVRDGDDWVINGRKMWGTAAHRADYVWLATRTDPGASVPHAGITVFLCPTGLPGWDIQQHRGLSGEISCSTFFDDVRIPDSARVGEVNGGWKVITDALANERVVMAGISARIRRQFDDLLAVVRQDPETIVGPRGSAARRRITEIAVRLQTARALTTASVRATAQGSGARLEAPMAKIVGGELAEDFGEAVLGILGPHAALSDEVAGVPGDGAFEHGLRLSIMYVVGGGTGDIQRNLIARALGLPR